MKTANQLTFTTYDASLKLKCDDPTYVIFDHIDWSFLHPLVKDKYSALPQGADGYDPISLYKAQLLIYLGEVNSDRKLAEALRYNGRLQLAKDGSYTCMAGHKVIYWVKKKSGADFSFAVRRQ